jgi:putative MATE family efflux protein
MPTSLPNDKLIKKKILSMTIPITAENILQMTAGVVSMAMVSRISPLAVGAIGISNIIFRIIWAVLKGVSTGCSVFVAQSHGAGEEKRLTGVSKQAFILSLGLAIIFQQLIYWFTGPLLMIFNPSPELLYEGIIYLRLLSWSLPMTAVILLVAGILQGMGNAKTPMLIIGVLNGVNIVLSYGLIFGKLGMPGMGLAGAAWAYNLSYLVAALMGIWVMFSSGGIFETSEGRRGWSFDRNTMNELIHFALPTTLEISFWQFASVIMTRSILTFGETAYAAYQLGLQAESISYMPQLLQVGY